MLIDEFINEMSQKLKRGEWTEEERRNLVKRFQEQPMEFYEALVIEYYSTHSESEANEMFEKAVNGKVNSADDEQLGEYEQSVLEAIKIRVEKKIQDFYRLLEEAVHLTKMIKITTEDKEESEKEEKTPVSKFLN